MRTWPTLLLALAGCEDLLTTTSSSSTATPTGTATLPVTTDGEQPPEPSDADPWSMTFHPCFGNRTDTMWFDDRDHVWVGCGSTTEGTGLYESQDGGRTWSTITGYFDTFRVSSISRSDDGLLYVAGTDTTGGDRVVAMDDDYLVTPVFESGGQVWNTFHVGTFRRNGDGLAVAESLTGTGAVARFEDGDRFEDASDWTGGGSSYQILDLVLHDDEFYGVGSTISQPPMVFLPPPGGQDAATGFRLAQLQLADFDGELWGLDVDDAGVVAAGVDQDADVGVIFTSGPDPYDLAAWRTTYLGDLFRSDPTWMRGACRNDDVVVAVGEFSRDGAALVLRSDDAGATWDDVTPHYLHPPSVHRCEVFADGSVVIAGAEGVVLTFTAR